MPNAADPDCSNLWRAVPIDTETAVSPWKKRRCGKFALAETRELYFHPHQTDLQASGRRSA